MRNKLNFKASSAQILAALGLVMSLGACGVKVTSTGPKPEASAQPSEVKPFQSDESRAAQIQGLGTELGLEIEIDKELSFDDEFDVNNALAALKGAVSKIRTGRGSIEKIILTSGTTWKREKVEGKQVLTIGVERDRARIVSILSGNTALERDEATEAFCTAIEERLFVARIQDLVGGESAAQRARCEKVEKALLGLNLSLPGKKATGHRSRADGLGIVLSDRFGVGQTELAIDAKASEKEIREFAIRAIDVAERAHSALGIVSSRVGYTLGIQPLVFGTEEYERALRLVQETGDAMGGSRKIRSVLIGRRFETTTEKNRVNSATVLVKLGATRRDIIDFVDTMPMTYGEEATLAVNLLRDQLEKVAGRAIVVEAIDVNSMESLGQMQALVTLAREALTGETIARHVIRTVKLGFSSKHDLTGNELKLAFPTNDPQTVEAFLKSKESKDSGSSNSSSSK